MPSSEVMHKWKAGTLRSGSKSGPPVKSQAQAVAIMLSEKRKEGQHGGKYPHKATGGGLGGTPPGGSLADNARRWQGFESRFPKDAPPSDWLMGPSVIGNRGQVASGGAIQHYALGGGLGILPGTNVPPLPGGVGLPAMPQQMPHESPWTAPQRLQQQAAAQMNQLGQMDWRHMGQMSPQGPQAGMQWAPMGFGMRADGGNVIPFPPSSNTPFGRRQIREELMGGKAAYEAGLPPSTHPPITMEDIRSRIPDEEARGGRIGLGYQFGGSPTSMGLTPGWIERQEARNISHTGPIISAVGGRTDNHPISVPSGSYVMPADSVSHLGQGNTLNGMQILTRMFGAPMKTPHGSGPPRMHAPRLMGMSSSGGSRGDAHLGRPVDIAAAGGEFVIHPHAVMKVGGGNLDHGHRILDRWVLNLRKKHIKTLNNLPPPAKT